MRRAHFYALGAAVIGGLIAVPAVVSRLARGRSSEREVTRGQAELQAENARLTESLRRRTREVEAGREQLRALVETTRALPWELELAERRFRHVGSETEVLFGIPASVFLAPGFLEASLHPEDREATFRALVAAQAQGRGQTDTRLKREDGRWFWVRFIVSSTDARSGRVRGILIDITEARQLELELRQAQKLESVGRLAAGVAHEINTPVQFVSDSIHFVREAMTDLVDVAEKYRVACEAALEGVLVAEAAAMARRAEETADIPYLLENLPKALDRALEGLERVTTIVRSMKEFAHPDQKEMALADVNQAVRSTTVIARNEYKYVADMELELGELPAVKCHLGDLNQVILNIIVNGAHAIGDVVRDSEQKGRLTVRTRHDGESVVIAISDTGGGIPAELQPRIFDPFFTTKEVGKGTGQGLAIARAVVCEKHGGELTFESTPGVGTTFFIRLPIEGLSAKEEAA